MTLPLPPHLSVYQLTRESLAYPRSLDISPATLRLLVADLFDVLVESNISARVWAKLPPVEGWHEALQRYQQQVSPPPTIYSCSTEGNGKSMQRECFLLVLSEHCHSAIVARSPELSPSRLDSSQRWQAICTFERRAVMRCWQAIQDAIDNTTLESSFTPPTSQPDTAEEKALLTQLLLKHVQRTEARQLPLSTNNSLAEIPLTTLNQPREPTPQQRPTNGISGNCPEETDETLATTPPPIEDELLRSKDELLKRVVQELRTPLTNMKTALKLLDSAQLRHPQRQRYMRLLQVECDRQTSLLAGLLNLAQIESDPQPAVMPSVQLADLIPGVVSTYQPLAQEKGIQLSYTIPVGLPPVACMETWLRQMAINLLHNSLKFTPQGGQVRVQATLQNTSVRLVFADTGIGIAAGEIPQIFNSFYRGRATAIEGTGVGLGLTIVQQLLSRCGGSIAVSSKVGEGTQFRVLLPVARHPSAANL